MHTGGSWRSEKEPSPAACSLCDLGESAVVGTNGSEGCDTELWEQGPVPAGGCVVGLFQRACQVRASGNDSPWHIVLAEWCQCVASSLPASTGLGGCSHSLVSWCLGFSFYSVASRGSERENYLLRSLEVSGRARNLDPCCFPLLSCLYDWILVLCLFLFLDPISFQVQELIINKDPTLLDNFLDVSD